MLKWVVSLIDARWFPDVFSKILPSLKQKGSNSFSEQIKIIKRLNGICPLSFRALLGRKGPIEIDEMLTVLNQRRFSSERARIFYYVSRSGCVRNGNSLTVTKYQAQFSPTLPFTYGTENGNSSKVTPRYPMRQPSPSSRQTTGNKRVSLHYVQFGVGSFRFETLRDTSI